MWFSRAYWRSLALTLGAIAAGAVLIVGIVSVHEAAHYGFARAVGVKSSDLRFAICGVNPCVVFSAPPTGWQRDLIDYSGGITVAVVAVLLYVVALRRYRASQSPRWWLAGLVMLVVAGQQMAAGIAEGAFHDAYIRQSTLTNAIQSVGTFAGFGLHIAVIAPMDRMIKNLRRKKDERGERKCDDRPDDDGSAD